jgi:hypothetical protein
VQQAQTMVTKGHRRLGRTIRVLSDSVELSSKESLAKESEKKYRETAQARSGCTGDSPVQSLRDPLIRRNKATEP